MAKTYLSIDLGDFEARLQELERRLNAGETDANMASVEDWRGYGGDSSDTGTLLAAVEAAKEAGGMHLHVPAQYYTLEQMLLVSESNIFLLGEGAGFHRAGTALTQSSPRTKFLWGGAAGGTIVKFQSPAGAQRRLGGGMTGIQLDGNNFLAARGLHIDSWIKGIFNDVVSFASSESQFRLSVVDYILSGTTPADTQANLFEKCLATTFGGSGAYLTSTAFGYHLTGGSSVNPGNSSFNTFLACQAYMSKGIAYKVENTDNNYFIASAGGAAYDSAVYGMELGSSDQDSTPTPLLGPSCARYNVITSCQLKIHARASQTGGNSSFSNACIGLSRANGTPLPLCEAGAGGSIDANVSVFDTDGISLGEVAALREATAAPAIIPRASQLYVDATVGPLKLRDSAGSIRTLFDSGAVGTWTPAFSFATPGDSVITHSIQVGKYLKLGNFVLFMLDIEFSTNAYTAGVGGTARISGLPFTCTVLDGSMAPGSFSVVTFNATTTQLTFSIPVNSSVIWIQAATTNAASVAQGIGIFPASKAGIRIKGTGMYWVA